MRPISQVSHIASERTLVGSDLGLQVQMLAAAGAALLALLASGYATFAHRSARHVLMVATTLPVFALFCRLAGFAAFRGRVPRDLYWPFADGRVAFAWIVLFAAVMHYATHDA